MKRRGYWATVMVLVLLAWAILTAQDAKRDVELSETERLRAQVIALKAQLTDLIKQTQDLNASFGQCQAALGPLQQRENAATVKAESEKLRLDIEKAHPGYTWDASAGQIVPTPPTP